MIGLALAGAGAFGEKHLGVLANISEARVVAVVDADLERARRAAAAHGAPVAAARLEDVLGRADIDAVILCTPTPLHSSQAITCLGAGKHVQVEIPLADNLADAEAVIEAQKSSGRIAMAGHTRRFNPPHRWLHTRIADSRLRLQHLTVQTLFFRRRNLNALGQPRTWTDHLLWHHAAHTVDLFAWQAGEIIEAHAMKGPTHPELGIAMDMSIQLKSASGALCTLALSFNNDGPFGTDFRYICDNGTFVARYDDLLTGEGGAVDLELGAGPADGVEAQDREFVASIAEGRAPLSAVEQVMPCYRLLDRLERQMAAEAA